MEIRIINKHEKFLIKKCQEIAMENYLDNLVLLGDLFPPCIDLTNIFGLFSSKSNLLSFFVIFGGFKLPSIVLPVNQNEEHFTIIMKYLQEILPNEFFFLSLELLEEDIKDFFKVSWISTDYCMIRDSKIELKEIPSSSLVEARNIHIPKIDVFYKKNTSSPWHPKQFESGFYFFIEGENKIIACGGTHFETPRLAQLGNIFVLEEYRGQHFGKILTTAITRKVLEKKELATLFVHHDNQVAINLYKKLGFQIYKKANLIFCKKNE